MLPIDDAMARLGVDYLRYIDDVLLLGGEDDLQRAEECFRAQLSGVLLECHDVEASGKYAKGEFGDPFGYLGYIFDGATVSVRPDSVRRLERRLVRSFKRFSREKGERGRAVAMGRLQWQLNMEIAGCVWGYSRRGWIHYFRQMNDLALLKRLDLLVANLKTRYEAEDLLGVKSFMRAYWSSNYPGSKHLGYFPHYDSYSPKAREALLQGLGEDTSRLTANEVDFLFRDLIESAVREAENDAVEVRS